MEVKTITNTLLQEEIISIMLNNGGVAQIFLKHIYTDKALEKKIGKVFTNPQLEQIATAYLKLLSSTNSNPTTGVVVNELFKLDLDIADKEALKKKYLDLHNRNVIFDVHHQKHIKEIIVNYKSAKFLEMVVNNIKKKTPDSLLPEVADLATTFAESLQEINFSKTKFIELSDTWEILDKISSEAFSNTPIGLAEIDASLNGGGEFGGAGKQEITVWLSGTNDGKSMVMGALAVYSALNKVHSLTLSFEGKELQTPQRMISAMTGISFKRISRAKEFIAHNPTKTIKDYFNEDEVAKIEWARDEVAKYLTVAHVINNSTIEYIRELVIERYKERPFEVLIVDYGQLVESIKQFAKEADLIQHVFREFEKIASLLKVTVHIAMQTNREGIAHMSLGEKEGEEYPSYKMYHVAGGLGALKTAATIIAINRTEKEKETGKIRFKILKQREGLVGIEVGIQANWECCRIFEGQRYMYSNPIEAQFGNNKKLDNLFSVQKDTSTKAIAQNAVQETSIDPLLALTKNSPILRAMYETEFTQELKDIMAKLIKIDKGQKEAQELEQRLSRLNSGAVECDDIADEKVKTSEEINAIREEIASFKKSIRSKSNLIENHIRWSKFLKKFQDQGVFQACKASKDPKAAAVSDHITITALLEILGFAKEYSI
jgi:replicative DNA helicase